MLIVLTPMVFEPKSASQFWPISLCSMLYKLTMNIITNQFKVVFPKIIAPEQAGFIARMNISDNILITEEVMHSMKGKKKKWR